MNRMAMILAGLLTAFALVLTGGVVAIVTAAKPAAAAAPSDAGAAAPDQREAQWRELLAQANERLQEAYSAQGQGGQTQPSQAAGGEIGLLAAARVAADAAPGARLLRPPERVMFEGVVAYEVTLDVGPVFVNAVTGEILYNGSAVGTSSVAGGRDQHSLDSNQTQPERQEQDHDND